MTQEKMLTERRNNLFLKALNAISTFSENTYNDDKHIFCMGWDAGRADLMKDVEGLVRALKSAQIRFRVTQQYVPIGEEHIATLLTMAEIDEALAKFEEEHK